MIPRDSQNPGVIQCLTKCTFLMLGTSSKSCKINYSFAQSNVDNLKGGIFSEAILRSRWLFIA